MHTSKLVVVGVGHVGSYVLADAMKMGLFGEIVTIDLLDGVARGEALDQHHATALPSLTSLRVHAGDYADCADADVIIIAAGPSILTDPANPTAQPDRALLAEHNGRVIREVMGRIVEQTREAVIIVITNPLDTIAYIAATEFGYPDGCVFGTGTMLDSARLRRVIADRCGVSPTSVNAVMMGEHGLAAFPALSHASVGGFTVDELPDAFGVTLDPEELAATVVTEAYNVLNAKGWTNAGVAQSAVLMARAVLLDEKSIFPASTVLRGEYGHDGDVALSMPCLIGRGGVERRLPLALNEWEAGALERSVAAIQAAMKIADAPGRPHR